MIKGFTKKLVFGLGSEAQSLLQVEMRTGDTLSWGYNRIVNSDLWVCLYGWRMKNNLITEKAVEGMDGR